MKEMIEGYLEKEKGNERKYSSNEVERDVEKERSEVCEKLIEKDQLFLLMNTDHYQSTLQ